MRTHATYLAELRDKIKIIENDNEILKLDNKKLKEDMEKVKWKK